jgi:hypothetical protein
MDLSVHLDAQALYMLIWLGSVAASVLAHV